MNGLIDNLICESILDCWFYWQILLFVIHDYICVWFEYVDVVSSRATDFRYLHDRHFLQFLYFRFLNLFVHGLPLFVLSHHLFQLLTRNLKTLICSIVGSSLLLGNFAKGFVGPLILLQIFLGCFVVLFVRTVMLESINSWCDACWWIQAGDWLFISFVICPTLES